MAKNTLASARGWGQGSVLLCEGLRLHTASTQKRPAQASPETPLHGPRHRVKGVALPASFPTDTLLFPGVRHETPGQCASPGSCSGTGWPHPSRVPKVPPPRQGWGSTLRAQAAIWGGLLPYPSSTRTQSSSAGRTQKMEQCPSSRCGRRGAMLLTQHSRIVLLPALRTQGCSPLPRQSTE